ncbi:type I restriction-modification system subunit M [Candidatus Izimaplasma bacterium ZiA1]|uniref:type I restriction-modification system subunit M n=1 Tax=Candidatus Izimoplasma sp. ZiA1 TaxID=2024899 RepID=UPI000BAA814D|nr:type I restriction-modification system subunit M [Candidatus Izimaplasma bacterium ZiA1]
MTASQRQVLESKLWAIANELRGNMGADEFRDYVLGLIFYKFLSEKVERAANKELEADNMKFKDVLNNEDLLADLKEWLIDTLGYFIEPKHLFKNLAKRAINKEMIIEDLGNAFKAVEQSTIGFDSEDEFAGLFEDVDLISSKLGKTVNQKNELISDVVKHLDEIDFKFEDIDSDILGDAYEYLIGNFASSAGKKAGEFYTPQQVSKILAKVVTLGKERVKSVYDPTCGSGSLLLRVAKEAKVSDFYGQELNTTTYNLARMNMILHNVKFRDFDIEQGDTLEDPAHLHMKFEAVVANPPYSIKWKANDLKLSDERFSPYGKLAPKSKADFAFVQHMIYQLDENGTMGIVLPHGVLFRGGAEGVIRKYLIEDKNYLDAIIGLPANLFFGTGIPTCILVFKKCREKDSDIMFIDASKEYEKVKTQNILTDEHVNTIVKTYKNRVEVEKYSRPVLLEEIKENDYNLNIPRYVDTFEEEEKIDLEAIANKIVEIDKEMVEIDKEIKKFCEELGIKAPIA